MRKSLAKALLALAVLGFVGTVVSACNTTEGIGKDMSAAGRAITGSADKNKGY